MVRTVKSRVGDEEGDLREMLQAKRRLDGLRRSVCHPVTLPLDCVHIPERRVNTARWRAGKPSMGR